MELNTIKSGLAKYSIVGLIAAILLAWLWPLRTVPTGSRGVVTVGGAIKSIESEGFMLVAPWEKLSIFNIRVKKPPLKTQMVAPAIRNLCA